MPSTHSEEVELLVDVELPVEVPVLLPVEVADDVPVLLPVEVALLLSDDVLVELEVAVEVDVSELRQGRGGRGGTKRSCYKERDNRQRARREERS